METRELQLNLLSVMKKLHSYCVRNNLRYIISWGTLLGAVRHKGFIPWDEDMDINMPREDCLRLLELVKTDPIASDVGVLHYSIDSEYHYNMIRIYDKNTVVTVPHVRTYPKNTGVWIDILPLDYYNPSPRYVPTWIALAITKILQSADLYALPGLKGLKGRLKQLLHHIFPNKDNQIAQRIDRLAMSVPLGSSGCYYDSFERGSVHLKAALDLFDDLVYLDFEDARFLAPHNYLSILEYQYGPTWMQPPPLDQQVGSHNILAAYKQKDNRI